MPLLIIPATLTQKRLDLALQELVPEFSRTQIQNGLKLGKILVNGAPAKAKTKVQGGEQVTFATQEVCPDLAVLPQQIPLDIIHEDDALLIINKPVGLIVHPGAGNPAGTLLNVLLYHHSKLATLPRGGIVHRLDKDTSGLLIVAKTATALHHLNLQLKKHTLAREYEAVVWGRLISGGTVRAPIGRHPRARTHMAVVSADIGKEAATSYRIIKKYRAHTHLRLKLSTGRTHQIRVHMEHIHHPIVGDSVYGKQRASHRNLSPALQEILKNFKRQALHAIFIELTHPLTLERKSWQIDLPQDFRELLNVLNENEYFNSP